VKIVETTLILYFETKQPKKFLPRDKFFVFGLAWMKYFAKWKLDAHKVT